MLAADNDPDAVRVARENVILNGLAGRVRVLRSAGYAATGLRRAAPFDLILANILAGPLIRMAPALARNLAPGGRAVLSGLLGTQAPEVLDAHRRLGLTLDFQLRLGEWSVLVLRKPKAKGVIAVALRLPRSNRQPSLPQLSWSAQADHPRVCRPRAGSFFGFLLATSFVPANQKTDGGHAVLEIPGTAVAAYTLANPVRRVKISRADHDDKPRERPTCSAWSNRVSLGC